MRHLPSRPSPSATWVKAVQQKFPWLYAFWKFSRPHTVIGTTLSVLGLYLIAESEPGSGTAVSNLLPSAALPALLPALLACLCGNIYIVGLNQLEDVEIDQVNKPHLPLASGEFSRLQGRWLVGVTGILALALSAWQGIWLMATVWLSLLIGTAYSLPPLRLKRFPVPASLCIFSVRGAIVNLGLFLHFNQRIGGRQIPGQGFDLWSRMVIPPAVWALTAFILMFTFAIAILKDIPDLEGDRRYHISTFTLRLGAPTVFRLGLWVLTGCYVGMIGLVAAGLLPGVNGPFLVMTHLTSLGVLWWRSRKLDLSDRGAIARYYQFIWKLFFLEYLLFPLGCLLGSVSLG